MKLFAKKYSVAIATAISFAVLGALSAPAANALTPTDRAFLSALDSKGMDWEDPQGAVDLGHTVCDGLKGGVSREKTAMIIQESIPQLSYKNAEDFVTLSNAAYCSEITE